MARTGVQQFTRGGLVIRFALLAIDADGVDSRSGTCRIHRLLRRVHGPSWLVQSVSPSLSMWSGRRLHPSSRATSPLSDSPLS